MKWVTVSEFFPHQYRASGNAFSQLIGYSHTLLLIVVYVVVLSVQATLSHWFIALTLFLCFLYLYFFQPETKGKMSHEVFPDFSLLDNPQINKEDQRKKYGSMNECDH